MLVALAIQQRQQQIVVELDLAAPGGRGFADDFPRHAAHAISPARLLGWAARIMTGTIWPMRSAGASAWTACR